MTATVMYEESTGEGVKWLALIYLGCCAATVVLIVWLVLVVTTGGDSG